MKEHQEGTLRSGSGQKVKSRKQAVAIALSEARKSGAKTRKRKRSSPNSLFSPSNSFCGIFVYCFSNRNEQARPSTRVPVPVAPLKCASML
jgi:hypothetical protein